MIRIEPYLPEHAEQIVNLWNASFDGDFPLDIRLWRQNVDGCDRTDWGGTSCSFDGDRMVGFVVAKRPGNIGAIVVHPKYRRQGIGTDMLNLAVDGLMASQGEKVSAGQDYLHFFPGIPEHCLPAQAFFTANGWNIYPAGSCWDLTRTLDDYSIPESVQARIAELAGMGYTLRPCETTDTASLLEHVEANFSERWLAETIARIEIEPTPREIMIAEVDSRVVGFCHTFTERSQKLGPSVYWRRQLGAHYGGLGPMGVAKEVRKIGLGLALLSYGVDAVRRAGAARMAIDWTVLVDFYGKIGFTPWKRYLPASRTY